MTKSYRFNGQVIAQRKNGVLSYLHGDHLWSTVLTTTAVVPPRVISATLPMAAPKGHPAMAPKCHPRFTGQKLDATGLQYFNSRYGCAAPKGTRRNLFGHQCSGKAMEGVAVAWIVGKNTEGESRKPAVTRRATTRTNSMHTMTV